MTIDRNRLYLMMFIVCLVGYIWLFFNLENDNTENNSFAECIFKRTTNIPCPSCGSTRSIVLLTKGHFIQAFKTNPLGYIVATIMLFAPIWMIVDMVTKRETLFEFYQKMEAFLRRRQYAIPLIFLIIINWIWNIAKGL